MTDDLPQGSTPPPTSRLSRPAGFDQQTQWGTGSRLCCRSDVCLTHGLSPPRLQRSRKLKLTIPTSPRAGCHARARRHHAPLTQRIGPRTPLKGCQKIRGFTVTKLRDLPNHSSARRRPAGAGAGRRRPDSAGAGAGRRGRRAGCGSRGRRAGRGRLPGAGRPRSCQLWHGLTQVKITRPREKEALPDTPVQHSLAVHYIRLKSTALKLRTSLIFTTSSLAWSPTVPAPGDTVLILHDFWGWGGEGRQGGKTGRWCQPRT